MLAFVFLFLVLKPVGFRALDYWRTVLALDHKRMILGFVVV